MKMKEKRILFACPNDVNITEVFINNLEKSGYNLYFVPIIKFKYPSFKYRFKNFLLKTFLNDYSYKGKLANELRADFFNKKINDFGYKYFDYALFIRPDLYPLEKIIKNVRYVSKKSIAYQWDGLNRYPNIFKIISYFDKFYVFQKKDFFNYRKKYPNLYFTQNFYSDTLNVSTMDKTIDIFYIGSYFQNRLDKIKYLYDKLKSAHLKMKIVFYIGRGKSKKYNYKYNEMGISFIEDPINYNIINSELNSVKVLLDFCASAHEGLSLRFFEAIKFKIKIITDNPAVKEYDFYNPQNVFILGQDNILKLKDFIYSAYAPLEKNIYEKYSFKNWITELLK